MRRAQLVGDPARDKVALHLVKTLLLPKRGPSREQPGKGQQRGNAQQRPEPEQTPALPLVKGGRIEQGNRDGQQRFAVARRVGCQSERASMQVLRRRNGATGLSLLAARETGSS